MVEEGSALERLAELLIERGVTVTSFPTGGAYTITSVKLGAAPGNADKDETDDRPQGRIRRSW